MAKKKIKKALKALVPMLAIAGLGKAFMNSRAKPLGVSGADKALFTSNKAMRNSMLNDPFGGVMDANDMANDDMFLGASAKKGGRIKKTKKGGRAVRKANRSKKK
jgi:hypothetical protein